MSKHIAIWPAVSVTVDGKSHVVKRGSLIPQGLTQGELDNLVSFGAIAGVYEAEATEPDNGPEGPKPGSADYILDEVGDDPVKAKDALDAEIAEKGDKARKGLVASLEKIIGS